MIQNVDPNQNVDVAKKNTYSFLAQHYNLIEPGSNPLVLSPTRGTQPWSRLTMVQRRC